MRERDLILLYARAHHIHKVAIAVGLVAACQFLLGSRTLALPTASAIGSIETPYRAMFLIVIADLVAGTMSRAMASIEATASRRFQRIGMASMAGTFVSVILLVALVELLTVSPTTAALYIRALIIWTGLALISSRIFGQSLPWVLPVASIFPLTYYGFDDFGRPHWWEWIQQSPESPGPWILSVVSLTAGACALWLTRWRLHTVKRSMGLRPLPLRSAAPPSDTVQMNP